MRFQNASSEVEDHGGVNSHVGLKKPGEENDFYTEAVDEEDINQFGLALSIFVSKIPVKIYIIEGLKYQKAKWS